MGNGRCRVAGYPVAGSLSWCSWVRVRDGNGFFHTLVIAPYLGVSQEVILFSSLVAAGMPFLLLVGAAPNAIAYESRQFSSGEFFLAGIPASILLVIVLAIFVWLIWPLMGMPVVAH